MERRFFPPSPLQVFSVDSTEIQLTWGYLPPGNIRAVADGIEVIHPHEGGPGSLTLHGLCAGTTYKIETSWDRPGRIDGSAELITSTLPDLGSAPIAKFATVSDLHIGARRFGVLKTMTDFEPDQEPFAFRCAQSAIEDAAAWGAQYLVIKGDAVHAQSKNNFRVLGKLIDNFPELPMMLLPGNHDVDGRGDVDHLRDPVGKRRLPFVNDVAVHDFGGFRIIGANTTIEGKGTGSIAPVQQLIVENVDPEVPSVVLIHQQLQRHKVNPYWPPGIPQHESSSFLSALEQTSSNVLVTSGHTHRNRVRRHGTIPITEVASTRDWPGVWAGYTVYKNGITQTVRRVSSPAAMRWHEYGRQAVGGLWSLWSPGRLEDRCFIHKWSNRADPQKVR